MSGSEIFLRKTRLFLLYALLATSAAAVAQPGQPAQPGQLGERAPGFAELTLDGPAIAGRTVTANVRFTLGKALPRGSSLLLTRHWLHGAPLQNQFPDRAGFVSILSDAIDASFVAQQIERRGVHGGLESIVEAPAFMLTAGALPAGSRVIFSINDLTLPGRANLNYDIPLYVSPGETEPFLRIPGSSVPISPSTLAKISLSTTSIVKPGEEVEAWIRLEDAEGNLVPDSTVSLDLLIDGVYRERILVRKSLQAIADISFDKPGEHKLEVRSGGGGLRAASNIILVRDYPLAIRWADIGVYSRASDGLGARDANIRARLGRYDLVIPADHGSYPAGAAGASLGDVTIHANWDEPSQGGGFLRLLHADGRQLDIALAERPADLRQMSAASLRLVQVAGPGSDHIWFGKLVAGQAFAVGFIGSGHSHQYPRPAPEVHTAVLVEEGQDWFSALRAGQTYVAVGARIILLTGQSRLLPLSPARRLSLEVFANSPVLAVSLLKNGSLLHRQQQPGEDASYITLRLYSSSKPFSRILSKPRNVREWIGYIRTDDAHVSVKSSDRSWQVRQSANQQRLDFLTRTHGNGTRLNLYLEDSGEDAVLEIGLAAGFEDAAWLPADRPPQPTPAQRFSVPLAEIRDGASRQMEVGGYTDTLELTVTPKPQEGGVTFSYTDRSKPKIGDYYYFHVLLMDGSFAYSSPIFVGL